MAAGEARVMDQHYQSDYTIAEVIRAFTFTFHGEESNRDWK